MLSQLEDDDLQVFQGASLNSSEMPQQTDFASPAPFAPVFALAAVAFSTVLWDATESI